MKLRPVFVVLCMSILMAMLTGCISSGSHAVGVLPSAKHMVSSSYEVLGEADGMSSSFTMFWIFPVTPPADSGEAVDEAVKSKGGDNLIEAVFTRERKVYIIGTVDIIHVRGKVIRYIQQ